MGATDVRDVRDMMTDVRDVRDMMVNDGTVTWRVCAYGGYGF